MQELRWSKGLAAAAADHVDDQGPIGGLEHRGTDGSDPARRAERRGRWLTRDGREHRLRREPGAARWSSSYLMDDGVRDRGHRNNILDPRGAPAGVACGPHRDVRQICVMDYAAGYVE